jgi:hypothetical protein
MGQDLMKTSLTQRLHPSGVEVATFQIAKDRGYDLVQYKAKGQPARVQVSRGHVRVYGWDDSSLFDFTITNDTAAGTFLGSVLTPDLIIIHDCIEIAQPREDDPHLSHTDLSTFGYRDRFAFVQQQLRMIDLPKIKPVQNYRIDMAPDLWNRIDGRLCNGLVYRKSSAPSHEPILVARWYAEIPSGLP